MFLADVKVFLLKWLLCPLLRVLPSATGIPESIGSARSRFDSGAILFLGIDECCQGELLLAGEFFGELVWNQKRGVAVGLRIGV